MTSHADAIHLQENVFITTAVGATLVTFGMSLHFMAHDAESSVSLRPAGTTRILEMMGRLMFLIGMVVMSIGTIAWRNDGREMIGSTTSRILKQVREEQSQPSVNEAGILAGVSAGVVVAAAWMSSRHYAESKNFHKYVALIYGAGWVGLGFSAAMTHKSIDSIEGKKLALTLPGALLVAGGTYLFPWQRHHGYSAGPALPAIGLGAALLTLGNSYNEFHST